MNQHITIVQEWLKKQPHLPQNIHEKLLERFLQCCDNSIEQAKQLIEKFYTLRSQCPDLFESRDPCDDVIQESLQNRYIFTSLPQMTEDRKRVIIYDLVTDDPEKYNYVIGSKASMMIEDVRLLVEEIADEEIFVFDLKNFTARHLTKIVPSIFRNYLDIVQESYPAKRTQIHLMNVPPYLDKIMLFFKPFLTSEALSIMHMHTSGSDTIYKYIPKDIMPVEYGGSAGSIEDIKKYWIDKIVEYKYYIQDPSRWKVDDSKRTKSLDNKYFGPEGSFRRLEID